MSAKHVGVISALALAVLSGCSQKSASFVIAVESTAIPACCEGEFSTVISETAGVPGELVELEAHIRDSSGLERYRLKADRWSLRAGGDCSSGRCAVQRIDSTEILGFSRLVIRHYPEWDSSWKDVDTSRLIITVVATIRDENGDTVTVQADESVVVAASSGAKNAHTLPRS